MRNLLQYWKSEQADLIAGKPLDRAGSSQYKKLNVSRGDTLWIVTLRDSRLHLVGRLVVEGVISPREARRRFGRENLYEADAYAVAMADTVQLAQEREIHSLAPKIRFISKNERLALDQRGRVDGKQIQSIRELTEESVALLAKTVSSESQIIPSSVSEEATPTTIVQLLKRWGFDLEGKLKHRVKVVRHASDKAPVDQFYGHSLEALELFQSYQSSAIFDQCDVIVSFIGTEHTTAKFVGVYEKIGKVEQGDPAFPRAQGIPELVASVSHDNIYYEFVRDERFDEFRDGLLIEWGPAAQSWHQWLPENDKKILTAISKEFSRPPRGRRNPNWSREELVLALDLYFQHPPSTIKQDHPAVVELSELLNTLGRRLGRVQNERFRNPNGVYMKLCNFLHFDPQYGGTGLKAVGKLDEVIWNEFSGKREELHALALAITSAIRNSSDDLSITTDEDEENAFPEGAAMYRTHLRRERSRDLVRKAKERARLKHGRLCCAICSFDFFVVYGELGDGYIECHHTIPVSELKPTSTTRLEDVVLLCANCHRMVHRKRPWLRISEVKQLLQHAARAGA